MKRANASSTAGDSRWGSRGAACPRDSRRSRQQAAWRDSFAGARQALHVAAARLRRSARSIEAGERLFAIRCFESDRHWRAVRRLGRVRRWLNSAGNRLVHAEAALRATTARAGDLPLECADQYGQASRAVRPATFEWLGMMELAIDLELRFAALGVCFREERKPGGLLADLPAEGEPPQLSPALLRRLRGDEAKPVTHQPYRQPIAISATAFRRVTRGRAPPALPLPTL